MENVGRNRGEEAVEKGGKTCGGGEENGGKREEKGGKRWKISRCPWGWQIPMLTRTPWIGYISVAVIYALGCIATPPKLLQTRSAQKSGRIEALRAADWLAQNERTAAAEIARLHSAEQPNEGSVVAVIKARHSVAAGR